MELAKRALAVFAFSPALFLTSCVSPGTSSFQYAEPGPGEKIVNEKVIAKPFSDTWDILVRELAKSFFVINNIDKASRFINISFSTNDPKDHISCGRVKREFSYNQESRIYEYEVAGSSDYKVAGHWGNGFPYVASRSRRVSLEGRTNIYVAPKGDTETLITANVRYVWTTHVHDTEEFMNAAGAVIRINPSHEIYMGTISFNTNQVGSAEPDKATGTVIKCRSTGLLESKILDLAGH